MSTAYTMNPPWVNRILNKHWDAIAAVAPTTRIGVPVMPEFAKRTRAGKMSFVEYGCGHYGCVIRSTEPGIVFKLTSDPSEAAFVAAARALPEGDWPAGMIRYYGLYELPEKHHKRRVFVLWRQEAEDIGALAGLPPPRKYIDRYGAHSLKEFSHNLQQWLLTAGAMREQMKRAKDPATFLRKAAKEADAAWAIFSRGGGFTEVGIYYGGGGPRFKQVKSGYRGALAFELRRILLEQLAMTMSHTHAGHLIGEAFGYYLEEGMLLADVHFNNIGEAIPEGDGYDSPELVITDPGHMVPLDPKWLEVEIPRISKI